MGKKTNKPKEISHKPRYYCKTCHKKHWFKYFGIWEIPKPKCKFCGEEIEWNEVHICKGKEERR